MEKIHYVLGSTAGSNNATAMHGTFTGNVRGLRAKLIKQAIQVLPNTCKHRANE